MFLSTKKYYCLAILILHYLIISWIAILSLGCGSNNIPSANIVTQGKVTLSWNEVSGANSYIVYFARKPGITKLNAYKIRNAPNPITITDLESGATYYFIITVINELGEGINSKEISYAVTATEGFIEFKDFSSKSKPDTKLLKSEEDQIVLVPAQKMEEKTETEDIPPKSADSGEKKSKTEEKHSGPIQTENEIIICFGDSLTFGTGANKGMDYPSQLQRMIHKPVVNEGLPGDTTASALRRLKRDVLSKKPDLVLITLGGNDLKNGISSKNAFRNLKRIVESIQRQKAKVIIGGLKFPNRDRGFGKGYEAVANETGAILVPNIFEGIMGNNTLMSDPIHPNNAGYRIIAKRFHDAMVSIK